MLEPWRSKLRYFWPRVQKTDYCWNWTGPVSKDGYARFSFSVGGTGQSKRMQAHHVTYILQYGPIPAGLEIDHECRNRRCVNPDHLKAVTHKVNTMIGQTIVARNAAVTHCPHGHEYIPDNTLWIKNVIGSKQRICKQCRLDRERRRNKTHPEKFRK